MTSPGDRQALRVDMGNPAVVTTAVLVLLALLFAASMAGSGVAWVGFYLLFVVATALVVRAVPQEPGSVLRRKGARRGLVVAIAAVTLVIGVGPGGTDVGLAAALVWLMPVVLLLNVALARSTRRVAASSIADVDEREEQTRNAVHRAAYWVFAVLLGGILVALNSVSPITRVWIWNMLHGGFPFAVAESMFMLPTMFLAWLEPDWIDPEARRGLHLSRAALVAGVMVAITLLTPALLSLSIMLGPRVDARVAPVSWTTLSGHGPTGTCSEFTATKTVGIGLGATLPLHGVVCWDGGRAVERWGFNNPGDCHLASSADAVVQTVRCESGVDQSGTFRFLYETTIQSGLIPMVRNHVVLRVAVDRTGRVLEFP